MENLDIAKFGGTSVGNFDAMTSSYKVVVGNKNSRIVVISACSELNLESVRITERTSNH